MYLSKKNTEMIRFYLENPCEVSKAKKYVLVEELSSLGIDIVKFNCLSAEVVQDIFKSILSIYAKEYLN